jgi:hypothetical protein
MRGRGNKKWRGLSASRQIPHKSFPGGRLAGAQALFNTIASGEYKRATPPLVALLLLGSYSANVGAWHFLQITQRIMGQTIAYIRASAD